MLPARPLDPAPRRRYALWILLALIAAACVGCSTLRSPGGPSLIQVPDTPPPEFDPRIAALVAQVNQSELYATTCDLQDMGTRRYGSEGNRNAAAYIRERLAAIHGLSVRTQGGDLNNIIATLPGEGDDPAAIVVGAHYDSTSNNPYRAPGATDNGCGIAIVLELARILSRQRYNHTLQFAFWNAEELRLQGSDRYVTESTESILLYLNYDSSCYDPQNRSVLDIIYNEQAGGAARLFSRHNRLYGIHLALTDNEHACTSDHRSFWARGHPAVMTHAETHGPAHTPADTVDHASFPYAKKNAQLGLSVLAEMAEIQDRPPP